MGWVAALVLENPAICICPVGVSGHVLTSAKPFEGVVAGLRCECSVAVAMREVQRSVPRDFFANWNASRPRTTRTDQEHDAAPGLISVFTFSALECADNVRDLADTISTALRRHADSLKRLIIQSRTCAIGHSAAPVGRSPKSVTACGAWAGGPDPRTRSR